MNTLLDLPPAAAHSVPRLEEIPMDALLGAPLWSASSRELAFEFGQSWLAAPEPELSPGTAWLAATDDALLVWADLADDCVRTFARADHEPLWDLGDTFEVFLQPVGYEGYFEFEVSPRGHLLQLRYPRSCSTRAYGIQDYILRERRLVALRLRHRRTLPPLLHRAAHPAGFPPHPRMARRPRPGRLRPRPPARPLNFPASHSACFPASTS